MLGWLGRGKVGRARVQNQMELGEHMGVPALLGKVSEFFLNHSLFVSFSYVFECNFLPNPMVAVRSKLWSI